MHSSAKREHVGIITNLGGQRLVLVTGRAMVEVHCLHELRGMRMKHNKEWCTCDRCGAEIEAIPKEKTCFRRVIRKNDILSIQAQNEEVKEYIAGLQELAENRTATLFYIEHRIKKTNYDLCPKCRKDFERFMKN